MMEIRLTDFRPNMVLICAAIVVIGCGGGGKTGGGFNPNITYNYSCLREFYISNSGGSDENNGTSPENAWQTIEQANNTPLFPGDCINLKRGDIFREMLVPSSSGDGKNPVVYKSYGLEVDPNPKIVTTEYFDGWWKESLITNSSFELFDNEVNTAETGWLRNEIKKWWYLTGKADSYVEVTKDDSVTGFHSLLIYKDDKTTTVLITQTVNNAEPSTEYVLKLYGRRESGDAYGHVLIRDVGSNLYLDTDGNWSPLDAASNVIVISEDEWNEKEVVFKTKNNAEKIEIKILNRGDDYAGGILVDDIFLAKKEGASETYWVGSIPGVKYYYGAARNGTRLPVAGIYEKLLGKPIPFENGYFMADHNYLFYTREDSNEPEPVEVGAREHGVVIRGKEWIVIDSIDVEGPEGLTDPEEENHDAVLIDDGSQHVTIMNLKVAKSSQYGLSSAINTHDVNFKNIEATANGAGGIYIRSLGGSVMGCHSHGNARVVTDTGDTAGIAVWGGAIEIAGNEVHNNGTGEAEGECDYVFGLREDENERGCREEAEISVWTPVDYVKITGNFVHDCVHGCIQVGSTSSEDLKAFSEELYNEYYDFGPGYPDPPIEITNNIIAHTGTSAYPARQGIYSRSSGIRIVGNSNVTIEDNIITDIKEFRSPADNLNQNAAVYISNAGKTLPLYAGNITILGNVFYGNTAREIHILSMVDIKDYTVDYNIYYREFNNTDSWWLVKGSEYYGLEELYNGVEGKHGVSFDKGSIFADPMFVNESGKFNSIDDFRFGDNSPALK